MIESIYVALTGLHGFQQGLRTIAGNTANINTPGFKSSDQQFADLVAGGGTGFAATGYGLQTLGTTLNFQQGQLQSTGKDLDLALDGRGLFTLRTADGSLHYTRDGQFKFDTGGVLVSSTGNEKVLGLDAGGSLTEISVAALKSNPGQATQSVQFAGNLSSAVTSNTVSGVTVFDAAGTAHTLSMRLDALAGTPNTWTVTLLDGTATVGTGSIAFINGQIDPAHATVAVTYTPAGQAAVPLTLDFSSNVTSSGTSTLSTLSLASQDGWGPGSLTKATFDTAGVLKLTYSNGKTVSGPRLALGLFSSVDAVTPAGENAFAVKDALAWQTGMAGEQGFGEVRAGMIEMSNVDLSQQFSNLVIMQRGYQASSQIVSTANEMLDELFRMRK